MDSRESLGGAMSEQTREPALRSDDVRPAGGRACVVLHAGALGDLVLSLRFVERLYGWAADPLHVTLISRIDPGTGRLGRLNIERVSPESLTSHWLYGDNDSPPPARLLAAIDGRDVVSFLSGPDGGVHRRMNSLRPKRLLSIDVRPLEKSVRHITEQWSTQAAAQGWVIGRCAYADRAATVPPRRDGPTLIHPGSGGLQKCWALARFREVATNLLANGAAVRFLLGPAELERWPAAEVHSLRTAFPVDDAHTPTSLADALRAARAYIGNDSGVTHLAAALDTPTIAVFGPTDARVWRPLGAHVEVVQGSLAAGDDWGVAARRVCDALSRLLT
jgi:heptosyltransferase-3